jgi:cell division protein ZapE
MTVETLPAAGPVLAAYDARIASRALMADPAQRAVAARLDGLARELSRRAGFFQAYLPARGLYIWGGVGRGKSMLMDLFFAALTRTDKRRVHFHDFMLEVHAHIHAARQRGGARKGGETSLTPFARSVAERARVLCFDEFFVTDIADAMILGQVFEALLSQGVTVVATSNRHPDKLYWNGLNRQLFMPFIDLLKDRLDVVELVAARDYRLERLSAQPVYYSPLGPAADAAMDAVWQSLTLGAEPRPCHVPVQGRELAVPRQAAGVARFGFTDLCEAWLGPADYLALAGQFPTVMIDHVPRLTPARQDVARRFVTLVDVLYEVRTKLIVSAEAAPEHLYPKGEGAFEFERTVSRLYEMRSAEYLAQGRGSLAEA